MFDQMRAAGLSDPVYRQTSASVRLMLRNVPRLSPQMASRLPRAAETVLQEMRTSGVPLGTGEITERTGWARPTVLRALHALREAGLVTWTGKSARDPRAVGSVRGE